MAAKNRVSALGVLRVLSETDGPLRHVLVLLIVYAAVDPIVFFMGGGAYHPVLLAAEAAVYAAALARVLRGYSSYIYLARYLPVDTGRMLYAVAVLYAVAAAMYLLVLAVPALVYDPYGAVSAAADAAYCVGSAALLGLGGALSPVMRGRPILAAAVSSAIYVYVAVVWGLLASLLASLVFLLASLAGLVIQHLVVVLRWHGG